MIGQYVLNADGEAEPCDDLTAWALFMADTRRQILRQSVGPAEVSTVFLGLDHNFHEIGPPILWETMVFGGFLDGEQARYSSRQDAVDGHHKMCAEVRESQQ